MSVQRQAWRGLGRAQTITSKVGVSIWVSTCSSGIKFVYMKDELSQILVWYSTDYARGHIFTHQNDIYLRGIENALKYTTRGGMVSTLHHL